MKLQWLGFQSLKQGCVAVFFFIAFYRKSVYFAGMGLISPVRAGTGLFVYQTEGFHWAISGENTPHVKLQY